MFEYKRREQRVSRNFLYFKYLNRDSDYYEPSHPSQDRVQYVVQDIPANCSIILEEDSPWKFYIFKNKPIKDQGWKIHISATMENAQDILTTISEVLLEREIAFKHLVDEPNLHSINSKNGNRTSSGKFITIYPQTDEEFYTLLNILYEQIYDEENGPYILSDKCWKNSNIFYRYGGFRNIENEKGEPCIKDEHGHLIPDNRTPYYQVPEFVKKFDQFLDSKNNLPEESEDNSTFNAYEFQGVLRFTNGGGIYLGERKSDKQKVVIKEARPKVGLDAQNKDAVERLKTEYEALSSLTDVDGIVNVIDYFKSWKHYFLVEEYVEGIDLQQWIAANYPFLRDNDKEVYMKNIQNIINKIINIVSNMHKKNIGMGDLQPSNIMITPDLEVKLIDFEAAAQKKLEINAAMQTMGFAHYKNKTHEERDWYAVKKIIRFCALPIGSVSDIEESITASQDEWIKREFGRDFYLFIKEIETLCDQYLSVRSAKIEQMISSQYEGLEKQIKSIIDGLGKGIINNLVPERGLIRGDIRQYELPGGTENVLTGGTGAALALYRSGNIDKQIHQWIERQLIDDMFKVEQLGLFTGKAGIATTLYELGYQEESRHLLKDITNNFDLSDISLRSGLAGIGLAFVSLYLEENNDQYLKEAKLIATHIQRFVSQNTSLTVSDWEGVPMGLIDGWSGGALFFSALYSITKNKDYYYMAKDLIESDLKNTAVDKNTNILQTKDDRNRLLPYLSGGSLGIGIAIWYLNQVSNENLYQEELQQIINLNKTRCTFNGGLFDGAGGFLLIPPIMDSRNEFIKENIKHSIDRLDLFLISRGNELLFPGNLCYRLSDDLFSGSAGIILALKGILEANPLHWLPLINSNSFVIKTSHNSKRIDGQLALKT